MNPCKDKITRVTRHLALALLTSFVLVACGGGGSGATTTPVPATTTPVTQQEPMQAGAVMAKPLMDVAMVGQPYENTVRVVPNDRRNEIVSLSITNPTAGGAQPSIDNTGKVTWTANDADFASTKTLRVTAKLKEGADVTVDTPVEVSKERIVYEVMLGPDEASYSDPEGRYLVRIKRLNPAQPIAGTLKIVEVFQASGYFIPEYRIANESNVDLQVIKQPVSNPLASTNALTTQAGTPYPLQVRDSLQFPEVFGSVIEDGDNVHTSRNVVQYKTTLNNETIFKIAKANKEFEFLASCDSVQACQATTKSPVILIHGFTIELVGLGGGEGTWGTLPDALIAAGHPVFEMRWMTQMRFEEAAGVLAKFGRDVALLTGNKPIIIAHSFGGIAAHLALQGQGIEFTSTTWEPVNVVPNEVFSQLITLDSPLSGISDSAKPNVTVPTVDSELHSFTYGRDNKDLTINGCASITCLQAGAFDLAFYELAQIKLNVSRIDPALSSSSSVFPGESIARIQKNQTVVPFLTITGIDTKIKDFNNVGGFISASTAYQLGDGLISLMGQSVNPDDFATNPYSAQKNSIGMRVASGDILDLNELEGLETSCLKKDVNGRSYWICVKAAHSGSQQTYNDYLIAHYPDEGKVWTGFPIQTLGSHPLKALIADSKYIAKAATSYQPTITAPTSVVHGNVVANGNPLANLLIRGTIINKSDPPVFVATFYENANANGEFNIDIGKKLYDACPVDINLEHYAIELEMGDGLVTQNHTVHIENLLPDHNLGITDLSLVADLVNVNGVVIDGQTTSTLIAGADVWLSQGINQTAERLRLLSDNNVARKVTTDASGYFSVTGLRPGNYSALVSKTGFSDQLQGSVTVAANGSLSFSLMRVLNPGDAAITLRWAGAAGGSLVSSDLDSHLIRLNSLGAVDYHIYYGNKTVPGLLDSLDRDDTDYEGPETITLALTSGMNYVYYVHNYSSNYNNSTIPGSYPNVTLNLGSSIQQFDLPLDINTAGRYWRVFDIVNGQVNRCLSNCLQDIAAPSGLQTQSSSTMLVPQPFRTIFENLPAKQ